MKRILLTIEYNGKNTCGWQMQAGGASLPARRKIPFHGILAGLEGTTVVHFAFRQSSATFFPSQKALPFDSPFSGRVFTHRKNAIESDGGACPPSSRRD